MRQNFKWLALTQIESMIEIRDVLEKNKIEPVFMDTDDKSIVRLGVKRFSKKASYILSNYGWENKDGILQKLHGF